MLSLSSPQLLSSTIHWSCNPPCRRAAEAFNQRRLQRRFRATLRAWREVAAARRYLRAQGAHAECLLERRMLGRVVGGWRRAALAGKLCHTLEVVRQLQSAVERVSQELQHKAQQVSDRKGVGGGLGLVLRQTAQCPVHAHVQASTKLHICHFATITMIALLRQFRGCQLPPCFPHRSTPCRRCG